MNQKPTYTTVDVYAEKTEFAKKELTPLLKRLKTSMVTCKEKGYVEALTIAEGDLEDNCVDDAIGRLENICLIFADHDGFQEVARRIKGFIAEYDNFEQKRGPERRYERQAKMIENVLRIERARPFFTAFISLAALGAVIVCAHMGQQTVALISAIVACIGLVVELVRQKNLPSLIGGLLDVINKNSKGENLPP